MVVEAVWRVASRGFFLSERDPPLLAFILPFLLFPVNEAMEPAFLPLQLEL
jgi:hypothetical protein